MAMTAAPQTSTLLSALLLGIEARCLTVEFPCLVVEQTVDSIVDGIADVVPVRRVRHVCSRRPAHAQAEERLPGGAGRFADDVVPRGGAVADELEGKAEVRD